MFHKYITGKFTLVVGYSKDGRQHLHVYTETKYQVKATEELKNNLSEAVHAQLLRDSSEYKETFKDWWKVR